MSINPNCINPIDVAVLQSVSSPTPASLKTIQDLLDWITSDPLRTKNQRSNMAAAIRWLGKLDGTPLAAIPLDVRHLVDDRIKRLRQHRTLKKARRSNIITLLNRVLCSAGILRIGTRRGGITSHDWTMLVDTLPTLHARLSVTSLARFCSGLGIEPCKVTLAVWQNYVDETLHRSSVRNPRVKLLRTIRASNLARTTLPGWPLPELPKPVNPRSVSVPKGTLPASFWHDIDRYSAMSSTTGENIFDKTWPKQLSAATLQRYRDVAWRTASAQLHEGRDRSDITSLAALLEVPWLQRAMSWFYRRAGGSFLKDHLNMAGTWVSLADNYVHPSAEAIDQIRGGIFKVIQRQLRPAGFSRKNSEKLEQFSSPAAVRNLLFLPFRIMTEVEGKRGIAIENATEITAAVGIELLLTTMIRSKNLAGINLTQNFWPSAPTAAGAWSLMVEADAVKNGEPLRFAISKPTVRLLDFYLQKCRPLLLTKPSDMLFLRTNGEPHTNRTMAALVSRTIRRRLDLDVNVHLFRHIGTMLYLNVHPGHFGVPQAMLGHRSGKTTQRFYAHLQATQAFAHFTDAVLGARNDEITKLGMA
jgi:hypothetical protein